MRFGIFCVLLFAVYYALNLALDLRITSVGPVTLAALEPRNDLPGLQNYAIISEGLSRGEQPTPEGFAQLKRMGVKTIVNLRAFHDDRDLLQGTGLQYVHLECQAWHPDEECVAHFMKIVRDPNNQPVFVHCQHGSDRTGMMVASYRMLEQNWSNTDAQSEIHNFGYHRIFRDIRSFLLEFDKTKMNALIEKTPPPKVEIIP